MDSRKKILDAAVAVFSKTGYHQSGMDEIAKLAGVAKGTLYYNFSSKSKLFAATVSEGIEMIISEVSKQLDSDLPFVDHFRNLIETNVSLYLKYGDLTKIIFNELTSGIDNEALREIHIARERYISFFAATIQAGQKRGNIKPLDTRILAVAIVGMLESLCNYHIRTTETNDVQKLVDNIFTLLSSGLVLKSSPSISEKI